MRTGLIARKVGMTRVFGAGGEHVPVTVLQIEGCQVVAHRSAEKDGYVAMQLGAGNRKLSRTTKPQRGHFAKANVEPRQKLAEFRVPSDLLIPVGAEITADHFVDGQYVDISGTTIGKGFQGVMKRHNFAGLRATHGVSISHRSHGSTGQRQDPGRTFKNKKMAGHMGQVNITTQNLEVVRTDKERGLVLVRGAVPGAKGGWVLVRDAVKSKLPDAAPKPGAFRERSAGAAPAAPQADAPATNEAASGDAT